jgi:hypothetical protein
VIRPALLCRSENSPALKDYDKKACVTVQLILDCFHDFSARSEEYFVSKGMQFKVLLNMDSAPGHPAPPLSSDHGVIWAFYIRRSFARIRTGMDNDPDLEVMQCWKDYSIADIEE